MAIANGHSLPYALYATSASPGEALLVGQTLRCRLTKEKPTYLTGDKAYDSDPLDYQLAEQGISMVAPHRRGRVRPVTQDGRQLRRYRKRWKIERLFAWLQNYRHLVVRYDYYLANYLAFAQLASLMILLKKL